MKIIKNKMEEREREMGRGRERERGRKVGEEKRKTGEERWGRRGRVNVEDGGVRQGVEKA